MKKTILLLALAIVQIDLQARDDLVAHEWGTFTSVQGGDGVLLSWKPLETSKLPGFVYDWQKPGLGRQMRPFGKGAMFSLQRMETPVVYFYANKEQTVDLEVKFPQGMITEWFPQAREVGPSFIPSPQAVVATDAFLHRVGAPKDISLESLLGNTPVQQSMIHWTGIDVIPAKGKTKASKSLPTDRLGSHYFTARDTDSAYVGLDSHSRTNAPVEYEKFLFYRGVGTFPTPLTITMKSNDAVTVTNSGGESLRDLFILNVRGGVGHFTHLGELPVGQQQSVAISSSEPDLPFSALSQRLSAGMKEALVARGLYPREAQAMVNTWEDSWFAEDGMRILYLLPRGWTDKTLPMHIKPEPRELVRVMVGRAEVLTPATEDELAHLVARAESNDPAALKEARARLEKLGRFAEPALYRAITTAKVPGQDQATLLALLTPPQGTGNQNGIAAREVGATRRASASP
jgi:hypothetical protein